MNFVAKLGVIALSVIGVASTAAAADLPVRADAPAPVYVAPAFTWTGFYVGAHAGTTWGDQSWTNIISTFAASNGRDPGQGNYKGYFGGIQGGYNYQMGKVVLGIEGELSGSTAEVAFRCMGRDYWANCKSKSEWFGVLSARAGVAVGGNALLFVKGGVAFTDDKVSAVTSNPATPALNGDTFSGSKNRTGLLVGAGVEYAIDSNWSAKIEYNYIDFGGERITQTPGVVNSFLGGFTWSSHNQANLHLVKVGLNYRFGWGSAPVVAKY